MVELSEEIIKQLLETHDKVNELHVVLLGINGDKGLVGKVEDACTRQEELEEKQNKLSHKVTLLIGILAGAGVLGGTTAGIIELLK